MTENVLPEQPDWLLGLSFQLGEDLTPHGDLLERLDAAVLMAQGCQQELVSFVDAVRAYELTIQGHTPVPQVWLDHWAEGEPFLDTTGGREVNHDSKDTQPTEQEAN